MKFDIITFGSATRDIFLRSDDFLVVGQKKFVTGKGLCLSLGSKIDIDEIHFLTGGGGTNTAAGFSNQGFKTAFCGMVGEEAAGEEIIKELKSFKVNTDFILKTRKKPTNYSVILSSGIRERTILTYRGASGELTDKDIPWLKLDSKWIYLAPLSGEMSNLSEKIVNFAKRKGIKVAMNPGSSQLSLPKETLGRILRKVDVLLLNQEEAAILTKIPYENEIGIFKKLDEMVHGICVMTKGPKGAVASDGESLYSADILKVKAFDWTGAGDSFASGFLSGFIRFKGSIEGAMQLGIANSASCLTELGAKKGLLKKNDKWKRVKVLKESCLLTGKCKRK
ncbi:MAG: carbohydrate kinase family protein [Candidatus Paceibacterota bacterium]|jgi:ribokinase